MIDNGYSDRSTFGRQKQPVESLGETSAVSVNKLIEELSTQALAEFDSEIRFRALAATGNTQKGLDLLDKLDAHFEKTNVCVEGRGPTQAERSHLTTGFTALQ